MYRGATFRFENVEKSHIFKSPHSQYYLTAVKTFVLNVVNDRKLCFS